MENVRAVTMNMDAFHVLTVNIAADMIPLFHHQTLLALFSRQICEDSGIESAAYQDVIILFHVLCSPVL